MIIDLGGRLLFAGFFLFAISIYSIDWNDTRGTLRVASYILGVLGIWGALFRISFKFQLTSHIRTGNQEIPFEGFLPIVRGIDRLALSLMGLILFGTFLNHYVSITYEFRDRFFLGERDFTSLGEIILNYGRGLGLFSPFHGDGKSSFLSHHFSPGIVVFLPWLEFFEDRLALAWGHVFFVVLTLGICLVIFQEEWKRIPASTGGNSINPMKWQSLWIFFLAFNLYLYRLLFSYHFEILFVTYFIFLLSNRLYVRDGKISKLLEILFLFLTLTVKEDAAIYISIYYLGEIIYKLACRIPNVKWDIGMLGISLGTFFVGIPFLREITGNPSYENWYHLWKHWMLADLNSRGELLTKPLGTSPDSEIPEDSIGVFTIIQGILSQPFLVLTELYAKLGTLWELSLGFGFLFYLAPRYFLYIFLILGIHFLSGREWHNTLYNYYIYPLFPVLVIASLEGLRKLADLSQYKHKMALGYLVLALVMYRNSWDASFPYTHSNLPVLQENLNSKEERNRLVQEAKNLQLALRDAKSVASQFDLGIWVPISARLYPLSKNPKLPNGEYPDYIVTNTRTGFSPYLPLRVLVEWEKEWEEKHSYKVYQNFGDIRVWKHMPTP